MLALSISCCQSTMGVQVASAGNWLTVNIAMSIATAPIVPSRKNVNDGLESVNFDLPPFSVLRSNNSFTITKVVYQPNKKKTYPTYRMQMLKRPPCKIKTSVLALSTTLKSSIPFFKLTTHEQQTKKYLHFKIYYSHNVNEIKYKKRSTSFMIAGMS